MCSICLTLYLYNMTNISRFCELVLDVVIFGVIVCMLYISKKDMQSFEDNYCGAVEVCVCTVCVGWVITCTGGACIF